MTTVANRKSSWQWWDMKRLVMILGNIVSWCGRQILDIAVSFRKYNSNAVIHTADKSSATAGFNFHSYIPPTWSLLIN